MNLFVTSDWHIDHFNIIKHSRRFDFMNAYEYDEWHRLESIGDQRKKSLKISRASLERMHDKIVENTNAVVKPNDVIWYLGDFYNGRSIEEMRAFRNRIHCKTINLCYGNHDKLIRKLHAPFAGHSTQTPRVVLDLLYIIDQVAAGSMTPVEASAVARAGQFHSPLQGIFNEIYDQTMINWHGQNLFMNHYAKVVWDKSHYGAISLYAHSHSSLEPWREVHMPNAKTLDVGIDYRYQLGLGYTLWSFEEIMQFADSKPGHQADHHAKRID